LKKVCQSSKRDTHLWRFCGLIAVIAREYEAIVAASGRCRRWFCDVYTGRGRWFDCTKDNYDRFDKENSVSIIKMDTPFWWFCGLIAAIAREYGAIVAASGRCRRWFCDVYTGHCRWFDCTKDNYDRFDNENSVSIIKMDTPFWWFCGLIAVVAREYGAIVAASGRCRRWFCDVYTGDSIVPKIIMTALTLKTMCQFSKRTPTSGDSMDYLQL
jgi:hypothetical protein